MPTNLNEQLAAWIATGGSRLGQIQIEESDEGTFALTHVDDLDQPRDSLNLLPDLAAMRAWTRSNEAGDLRPLKTSPDLRPGWLVLAGDIVALREALECLYPGMVAAYFRHQAGRAAPVSLRETLERQTGMYRFARSISDAGAESLVEKVCQNQHCLKRVLWPLTAADAWSCFSKLKTSSEAPEGEIPLLCLEPCFLIIAGARLTAKSEHEATEKAAS